MSSQFFQNARKIRVTGANFVQVQRDQYNYHIEHQEFDEYRNIKHGRILGSKADHQGGPTPATRQDGTSGTNPSNPFHFPDSESDPVQTHSQTNQPENTATRDHTSHGSTSSPNRFYPAAEDRGDPADATPTSAAAQNDEGSANRLGFRESQEGDPVTTNQNHNGDNYEQSNVGRTSRDIYNVEGNYNSVQDSYNVEKQIGLSAIVFPHSPIFANKEPHGISAPLMSSRPYFTFTIPPGSIWFIALVSILPHYVLLLSRSSYLISDSRYPVALPAAT
ncbi:hypothetical protein AAF712_015943 [Marasmius tenuissimus]|uniref:Uncharacterized protein n=1 Tax=Marasmius tenuissimus TaxID=585030 RepID=A0ABR2Z769_9AGAR